MLQYCKNIYEAVRKVSEIFQELFAMCGTICNGNIYNVCSKHYKSNVAAIFIFHCNIAVIALLNIH